MVRPSGRKLLWGYALLLLLAAIGYARYDVYVMDGDGTAFLDIAQALNTHHAALAINGYWNPGYPAVLAGAERLMHPSLWRELATVRFTNVLLFACAMAATILFTSALLQARQRLSGALGYALSAPALHLLGLGLLCFSLGRELPVAAPRSDTLLFTLFMLAGGLLLRFLGNGKVWPLPVLGLVLGCAYLTKSFAFLPSLALFLGLFLFCAIRLRGAARTRGLLGSAMAVLLFCCVAGPYIFAISRALGHFTTGESARLNYAFFIDLTPRWHEWYRHDLGHAGGVFVHPESPIASSPTVFSFAAHPEGTFPLWFDPAWWTLGIKPHFWPKGHVLRLLRNVALFVRYLLGRPEVFVLLAVLIGFGASWPWRRLLHSPRNEEDETAWQSNLWWLAPFAWGALMLAIYFPVDLQDRYLTAPLFLMVLPFFAALRCAPASTAETSSTLFRKQQPSPALASALVVLFAGMALAQAGTYLADRRRHIPTEEQRHPGFDPQIFGAAAGLEALGVKPGDKIACMGDLACYTDHYWARIAGAQILAQVDTPDEANPLTVWNEAPDRQAITAPLARLGLRYIVAMFPNSGSKPAGWIQLSGSNFFAYPLQQPVSPRQAARVAALQVTP